MKKTIPILLLLIFAMSGRFLPHPANFVPVGAVSIFAGLYLPKKWAYIAPLLTMLASDIFIGFYSLPIMLSVYGSFVIGVLLGNQIKNNKKIRAVFGGTLLFSIIFFLLTNAFVWAFGSMYSHDIFGLAQSYYMALPFFRNSLTGDLFYTGVLVGGMEMIYLIYSKKIQTRATQP